MTQGQMRALNIAIRQKSSQSTLQAANKVTYNILRAGVIFDVACFSLLTSSSLHNNSGGATHKLSSLGICWIPEEAQEKQSIESLREARNGADSTPLMLENFRLAWRLSVPKASFHDWPTLPSHL